MRSTLIFLAFLAARVGCFTTRPYDVSSIVNRETELLATRRDVLIQSSSVVLASLLSGKPALAAAPSTILITGANSGVGFEACKRLAQDGHNLILACRTIEKATAAANKLNPLSGGGSIMPAECDLASVKSIDGFVNKLPGLLGSGAKIHAVCLNAGLSRNTAAKDCARTADGFELTVGTNHFGHFYLNHLVLPFVDPNGKIIVTASGVHDPESPGGAQGEPAGLGTLDGLARQGKSCEMIDGSRFNADKAYKDSKLCNVLFTRELQRRLEMNAGTKGIIVNCFNPGLIVGTGLFRDQNPIFTKVFDFAATDLFKVGETPDWGGGCLAYMTTVDTRGLFYSSAPGSSKYGDAAFGSQFKPFAISKEAQDDAKARLLWELSAKELGIPA
ncbi:protochlorophyllide reductase [Fistulifera solaris]|uniref:protochlorophyllide reductase n=1 Tax=Fistulifera solaris TaxID=1519565 RepID=A0A1Z5JZC4_FISSO|nr:protochlorophyllide reductase [Fistulifera solaris]|eukprot:GAX19365.1 protochlorophyllide reductase [Fistulifera solaris]